AGDFTAITSPTCNGGKQITLSPASGFVNNKISSAAFSPVALNIQKLLPAPLDACGKTIFGLRQHTDENIYIGRMDFTKSEKSSFFWRVEWANLNKLSTYDGVNPLTINQPASHFADKTLALGHTYSFSASVVNSFRAAVTRSEVFNPDDVFKSWKDLGVEN